MAKGSKVVWRENIFFDVVRKDVEQNMGKVVNFLRNEVVKSINTSQPTKRAASGKRTGLNPSKPGEAPKRVEGDLVKSITTEVFTEDKKVRGFYGSTQTDKALALEFGTSDMEPRPFLRPPLTLHREAIVRMLSE